MVRKPLSERFWPKVPLPSSPDGCMEWSGNRDIAGYGVIRSGGKDEPVLKAHRVAWEFTNGPIPDGLFVCHSCDNPPCVRPDHLFVGTVGDNNRDMIAKGRYAKVRPSNRGELHHGAKLSEEQVRRVRVLRAEGKTYTAISDATGVNRITACAIIKGRIWAWLDAEAA